MRVRINLKSAVQARKTFEPATGPVSLGRAVFCGAIQKARKIRAPFVPNHLRSRRIEEEQPWYP